MESDCVRSDFVFVFIMLLWPGVYFTTNSEALVLYFPSIDGGSLQWKHIFIAPLLFVESLKPKEASQIESAVTQQIYGLLEHYKQTDPVGLPGAPVPDPFPVDDVKRSIGMGTLTMKNTKAYGFSKFRIKSVKLDLNGLMVRATGGYWTPNENLGRKTGCKWFNGELYD